MMRTILFFLLLSSCFNLHAQVGFNNPNPDASSLLDLKANDKGLLIPRMSSAQRDAIGSPAESLLVFDTDKQGFYFRQGGNWYALNEWVKNANSNDVSLSGNASVTGTMSSNALSSNTLTNSGSISTGTLTSSGNISSSTLNTSGNASVGSVSTSSVSSTGNVSAGSLNVSGFATNALVPTGAIMMWSGSIASIPSGWALCNGGNGTPDLRNRFVLAAGASYGVGSTGGAESVTLNANHLPEHVHAINDNHSSPNVNTTGLTVQTDNLYGGPSSATTRKNVTTNSPVDIRPLYYALAYIMKL